MKASDRVRQENRIHIQGINKEDGVIRNSDTGVVGAFRAGGKHGEKLRANKNKKVLPEWLWEQNAKDESYQSRNLEEEPH